MIKCATCNGSHTIVSMYYASSRIANFARITGALPVEDYLHVCRVCDIPITRMTCLCVQIQIKLEQRK